MIYKVLSIMEKGVKGLKIVTKLSYYKLKYGKRLKLGKGVHFRKGLIINISKDGSLEIGNGTFFNNYCSINCHDIIKIGKNNLFGEGVKIYDHNHVFNDKKLNIKDSFKSKPINIGNNNWFGSNVIILSGVQIGDNNVFGAGITVDSKYGSNTVVRADSKVSTEKIRYKAVGGE